MNDSNAQYRILHTLATGATAVLYKAIQTSLDRPVVLKRLHAHLIADPDFARRFRFEAKAAAQLDHENIVRIIDFGSTGDNHFIVMEYIDGQSLKEVLAARRVLGDELTLLVAHGICLGLDHAHRRGIVHRDVKPANVMIGVDGQVKITDFGLAKLHLSETQQTVASTLIGTPLYMSPEQAIGEAIDGRSDIFSLGTICFEALTGTQPFLGENYAAVIHNILNAAVQPPSRIRNDVRPETEAIVMKALARDPSKRFHGAADMARAIESTLGQETMRSARERVRRLEAGEAYIRPCRQGRRPGRGPHRRLLPAAIAAAAAAGMVFLSVRSGLVEEIVRAVRIAQASDPSPAQREPIAAFQGEEMPGVSMIPIGETAQPAARPERVPEAVPPADTGGQGAGEDTAEALPGEAPEPPQQPAATTQAPPAMETPPPSPVQERTPPPARQSVAEEGAPRSAVVEAAPRAERETGFLDIAVEPPGQIIIDGELRTSSGRLAMLEIPAGSYEIVCRLHGHRDYIETVRITKGELSRRRIVLRQITGSLVVESESGARLIVDGVHRGTTPLSEPIEVAPGRHRVELAKPGYRTWSSDVYVSADEPLRLSIRLFPLSDAQ